MSEKKVMRSRLAPTGKATELGLTTLQTLLGMLGLVLDSYKKTGRVTIVLKQRINRLFASAANRYNKVKRDEAKALGKKHDPDTNKSAYDVIRDVFDPEGGTFDISTRDIIACVDGLCKDAQLGINLGVDDTLFVFYGIVKEYVENPAAKDFITMDDILSDAQVNALDNTPPFIPARAGRSNGQAEQV
jgi:hypothetical protein